LQSLKSQSELCVKDTYLETRASLILRIEAAQNLTEHFRRNGILGRDRDFSNVVDASLSAITVFDRLRGMVLNQRWGDID